MKAITTYRCELCGNIFNDAYQAIECEKKHVKIVETKNIRYSKGSKYPTTIWAGAEDDTLLRYVRDEY